MKLNGNNFSTAIIFLSTRDIVPFIKNAVQYDNLLFYLIIGVGVLELLVSDTGLACELKKSF